MPGVAVDASGAVQPQLGPQRLSRLPPVRAQRIEQAYRPSQVHPPSAGVEGGKGGRHLAPLPPGVARQKVAIVVAELQKALDPGGRVVGPLAVKAVGQQEDEAGLLPPPLLGCRHKQVYRGLGIIGEVPKLGLPHDQGPAGGAQGVSIFVR